MTAPLFITTEKKQSVLPILVVDKQGALSKGLISLLSEHFAVVSVSEKQIFPHLKRVMHVPFRRKVPAIPDDLYAGLIVFYHGEAAIKDGLPSFVKKAKQNNAKLILITSRAYAESPFLHKAVADYEEAQLLIYGNIFGVSAHEVSLVTHMVHEAAKTGKISVHGSGLSETYPVYYADVLQGILHVLLSHGGSKVGLLYPKSPVAQIHLARLLTKLFPHASIMFIGQEGSSRDELPHFSGETLVADPYPLAEKLQHITSFAGVPGVKLPKISKRRFPRLRRQLLPVGMTLGGMLLILLTLTFVFFGLGLLSLKVAATAGRNGEVGTLHARSANAKVLFTLAEQTAGFPLLLSQPLGLSNAATFYTKQLAAGKTAADVAEHLAGAGEAASQIGGGKSSEEAVLSLSFHLKQTVLGLGRLRADDTLPATYKADLLSVSPLITRLSGVVESLPYLLGARKERIYLVLFQNNMELRPGGGFIGSYGLLTLKNGDIARFTVHTVYDADGQLTGHLEPPYALRRYLGASHLFLRDSNFSVEFAQNAASAAELLRLSTNQRVDGVITMDVSFLRSLLRITGPVYIPAYNETVTADTFYLAAEKHAEQNFFPGSSQKQDFLQAVAQALMLTLTERKQLPIVELVRMLDQALREKHVMVASADSSLMRVFTQTGFAPSIKPGEDKAQEVALTDFIGVFDANIGTNKANYYLKRSFTQHLSIQPSGERSGEMTVQYTNTSTKTSQFGGDYKNYIQVVLPETADVTGVSIDGAPQTIVSAVTSSRVFTSDRFVPPAGLELSQESVVGRSLFGFFIEVPQGTKRTVSVTYRVPGPTTLPEHFSYVLRVFKQPGTDFDPYQLVVNYEPPLRLAKAPAFASRSGNTLRVTQELAEDIILPLSFTKP